MSSGNYSGPSTANNLFSAWPHCFAQSDGSFTCPTITPDYVVNNFEDYLESAGLISAYVIIPVTMLFAVGVFVSLCCRCKTPCCAATRTCAKCDCCPRCCCRTITFDPDNPPVGLSVAIAIIGAAAVVLTTLALGYWIGALTKMNDVVNDATQLDDMYNQNIADIGVAITQSDTTATALVAIVDQSQNQSVPAPTVALASEALFRVQQGEDALFDAQTAAGVDIGVADNVNTAKQYLRGAIAAISVLVALWAIFVVAATVTSFVKRTPLVEMLVASESITAIAVFLAAGLIGASALLLVVFGDFCQQPNNYINTKIQANGNNTAGNAYVSFYVNCPPGENSPNLPSLILALNSTQDSEKLMTEYAVAVNGTYDSLYDQSIVVIQQLQMQERTILLLIAESGCDAAHTIIVHAIDNSCGLAFYDTSIAAFALPVGFMITLILYCLFPRRAVPQGGVYKRVSKARTDTPPSPRSSVSTRASAT
jgi:hypothetical protein